MKTFAYYLALISVVTVVAALVSLLGKPTDNYSAANMVAEYNAHLIVGLVGGWLAGHLMGWW